MDFLGGSVRIGRWFGINVRVHVFFFIFVAFELISPTASIQQTLIRETMLFAIVLMHEFGHCFGARSVGGDAEDILMWPLGGLAFAHAPMTPWAQFVTVACGPLVNVLFCLVSGAILVIANGTFHAVTFNPLSMRGVYLNENWHIPIFIFYHVNLMLLAFNLLPVFPFDGGQLFRTFIWPFIGLHRATIIAAQLGIIGAIALGIWGVQIGAYLMVGIAIFGGMTSYQHLQAARHGLAQDRFLSYESAGRAVVRRRGVFSKLLTFWRRPRADPRVAGDENPNPGAWEAKMAEQRRVDADMDRILKKVSENGLNSLTYVERQTLQHATRLREERERELGRTDRM